MQGYLYALPSEVLKKHIRGDADMSSGNSTIPYHHHHPNQTISNLPARATMHLDTLIT